MRAKALCFLGSLVLVATPAFAWGGKGHRIIGELAARNFPAQIPAFLRTPQAIGAIGEMAREPDRSRGTGQPHDNDRDPAHFVDVSDDGTILGGPPLASLPADRQDYDTALRAVNSTQYKAGWLPYAVIDGWQQLVRDFGMWRADNAGLKFARTADDRKYFTEDRRQREFLALRDLGVWAHFVGDASQPMHASVHYNGWGDFPNPENFNPAPNFHARFETDFVNTNIAPRDVAALMTPLNLCHCPIGPRTAAYIGDAQGHLLAAFRLDKAQAFDNATPEAKEFVAARLAAAASMLRDMVADAWAASDAVTFGYQPAVSLKDVEAGKTDIRPLLAN